MDRAGAHDSYQNFPWRQDRLYAYRRAEHVVVLAAIAAQATTRERHYRSTPDGYAPVPRPVLMTEAVLLLLDYRGTSAPDAAKARLLEPLVLSSTVAERERVMRDDEAQRKVWAVFANETFAIFEPRTKSMLGHFTDQQLRDRHALVVTASRTNLALFTNPRRHFLQALLDQRPRTRAVGPALRSCKPSSPDLTDTNAWAL